MNVRAMLLAVLLLAGAPLVCAQDHAPVSTLSQFRALYDTE